MSTEMETRLCKHCQTEIPKKAKVCPNCRKKQGGIVKWIVLGIIVIAIIGAVAGGGSDDSEKTTAKKTGNVQEENNDKKEVQGTETDNEFVVGDIVETKELKITYLSAGEYTSDNMFLQPKDGNVYYRMEFEFENISDTDQTISGMVEWNCYADSYSCEQSYIGEDQISATLSPGKKVKGSMYYEVPKEAEKVNLEYETNFWTEDKIIFVVK